MNEPIPLHENRLVDLLKENGFPDKYSLEVAEAGYSLRNFMNVSGGATPAVMDNFYGTKMSGIIAIDQFLAYLRGELLYKPSRQTAVYRNIRTVADVVSILESQRHKPYLDRKMLSFRGQPRDYLVRRRFPNPIVCDDDGMERMIVPSFWRGYIDAPLSLRPRGPERSIFSSIDAEALIFHGISGWRDLGGRNFQKYGIHTISELEEFPDDESREYYQRWRTHFVDGPFTNEMPLLEQHYGMRTIGLDVSFDALVGLFFASHMFKRLDNGKSTFFPIERGSHRGVLYLFVFRDPPIRSTERMVTDIGVFRHLRPIRPISQRCALPAFHYNEIGAAVLDLDAILFLDECFSIEGLPRATDLFPISEDKFYIALLEEKKRHPEVWGEIIDYQFD